MNIVTPESEWWPYLTNLPSWSPSIVEALVLSPHPDDETLGCGGLIFDLRQRRIPVTVIAVTDGENAYQNNHGLAAIREQEQLNALQKLGVEKQHIIRLRLTDSAVTAGEAKLETMLKPYIHSQTQVIAPWEGDFHPDHQAVGRAAAKVARGCKASLTAYFFWTWHYASPSDIQHLSLCRYELEKQAMAAKGDALACHHSQLHHIGEPPVLPASLLKSVNRPYEVFLTDGY